jgi:peptide/nickel transport system permease protein
MVIPTLLGVTVIVFLMLRITPGDPAELLLGERATPAALDAMREYLGLKEPLYVQYGMFIKRAIQLDLGETIFTREKVSNEIGQRFPATIELAVVAMLISCFFDHPRSFRTTIFMVRLWGHGDLPFGVSMPVFWLGLTLCSSH